MTDNYFMNFPARMQDGRLFTDYRSSCILNSKSLSMSSLDYRNYLTNNADNIIKNNMNITEELIKCTECSDYSIIPPYVTMECNSNNCIQKDIKPDGVGIEIVKNNLNNYNIKQNNTLKSN